MEFYVSKFLKLKNENPKIGILDSWGWSLWYNGKMISAIWDAHTKEDLPEYYYQLAKLDQPLTKDIEEEKILQDFLNHGELKNLDLIEILQPILDLFENGNYEIVYEEVLRDSIISQDYFKSVEGGCRNPDVRDELEMCKFRFQLREIGLKDLDEMKFPMVNCEAKNCTQSCKINLEFVTPFSIMDGRTFLFTQDLKTLSETRVKFYEEKIRNGEKPVAIVLGIVSEDLGIKEAQFEEDYKIQNNTTHHSWGSQINFVIDGHHKLTAYQNLQEAPRIISILKIEPEQLNKNPSQTYGDFLKPKELKVIKDFSNRMGYF